MRFVCVSLQIVCKQSPSLLNLCYKPNLVLYLLLLLPPRALRVQLRRETRTTTRFNARLTPSWAAHKGGSGRREARDEWDGAFSWKLSERGGPASVAAAAPHTPGFQAVILSGFPGYALYPSAKV